ncbi:hypothetical protein Zmor_001386 [Zophobas morio]|uniref:Endonuclease/exonuclease/phosphatase domain-containing protein n=1 Tax=Zophobas morio TaxID=2755281 RepID=A0AA38J758_9CUCU|nr:hypothetical protein Zmor_001386 [Zophobas morio]
MFLKSPISNADVLGIRIVEGCTSINILALYVTSGASVSDYTEISSYMETHWNIANNYIIIGDFNIPQYASQFLTDNIMNFSGSFVPLKDFIDYNNLKQHNLIFNHNDRLLDLVFTSSDLQCDINRCECPLVPEDNHNPSLELSISKSTDDTSPPFKATSCK